METAVLKDFIQNSAVIPADWIQFSTMTIQKWACESNWAQVLEQYRYAAATMYTRNLSIAPVGNKNKISRK